jgi:hypothetical protein
MNKITSARVEGFIVKVSEGMLSKSQKTCCTNLVKQTKENQNIWINHSKLILICLLLQAVFIWSKKKPLQLSKCPDLQSAG